MPGRSVSILSALPAPALACLNKAAPWRQGVAFLSGSFLERRIVGEKVEVPVCGREVIAVSTPAAKAGFNRAEPERV